MDSVRKNAKRRDINLIKAAEFNLQDENNSKVWDELSSYIEKCMLQSKGVAIPGLGTFTFFQQKIEVGHQNKHILIQRPAFVISEKLTQTHLLKYRKVTVSGHIPVQSINFTYLSTITGIDRDLIQLCVKRKILLLNRSVMTAGFAECLFPSIGKLEIKNQRVRMIFSEEFVNGLDEVRRVIVDPNSYLEDEFKCLSRNENIDFTVADEEVNKLEGIEPGTELSDISNKTNSEASQNEEIKSNIKSRTTEDDSSYKIPRNIPSNSYKTISSANSKNITEMSYQSTKGRRSKRCLLDENEQHSNGACSHREFN